MGTITMASKRQKENKILQMQVNDWKNYSPEHKHNERGAVRKWHDSK